MSSWLAIVNPMSGARNARARDQMIAHLRPWANRIELTKRGGHATEIARTSREHEGIIVAGGDGTLCEVLQGLDLASQRVLLLPTGRGNSLARDLGLHPLRLDARVANAGHPDVLEQRRIDLLEVTCRSREGRRSTWLSASTVAIGYPAEVAVRAGAQHRGLRSFSYVAASLRMPTRVRDVRIRYSNEATSARRPTGVIVSNTRHAANFVLFPRADCSDGTFEVLELARGRIGQMLHNVSALAGRPFSKPPPRSGLTSLTLEMDVPHDLLIDGEIVPDIVSFDVRILPAALTVALMREHA